MPLGAAGEALFCVQAERALYAAGHCAERRKAVEEWRRDLEESVASSKESVVFW